MKHCVTFGAWQNVGPITQDAQGKPVFPKLPKAGGVYRFYWPDNDYIGHTRNLRDRMGQYRNWKKRHTHPGLFDALRAVGGNMQIMTDATLDGSTIDLKRRDGRELLEGLMRYTQKPTLNMDN